MSTPPAPLPESFTHKTISSTCTVWIGAANTAGYGVIQIDGKAELAHRIAYAAAHGPIPDGMVIDHLCRVRNCVRVEHLEAVTQAENVRRGRRAASLDVGDTCSNGHLIADDGLYVRPSGKTECRECRAQPHRKGPRPSMEHSAAKARARLTAIERESA